MPSREIAHSMHVTWNEYWDFLGSYCDLSRPESLDKLEQYLARLSEDMYLFRRQPSICVTPAHSQSERHGETLFRSHETDVHVSSASSTVIDRGHKKPSNSHVQPPSHPVGVADTVYGEENLAESEESLFPLDLNSPYPPPSSPFSPSLDGWVCFCTSIRIAEFFGLRVLSVFV